MNEKMYFRAYSESNKLPFYIRYGQEIMIGVMLVVVIIDEMTPKRSVLLMLLFLSTFLFAGFTLIHLQFGTSIRINTLKNEVKIHTIGYKKQVYTVDKIRFGMILSERLKEIENALLTDSDEYFIPEGIFFNKPKKLKRLKTFLAEN